MIEALITNFSPVRYEQQEPSIEQLTFMEVPNP
jgi:hypothetical protein